MLAVLADARQVLPRMAGRLLPGAAIRPRQEAEGGGALVGQGGIVAAAGVCGAA